VGIVTYAGAVAFYMLLAFFRLRRSELPDEQRQSINEQNFASSSAVQPLTKVCFPEEVQGK
jgi:hypothetical protein